MAYLADTAASLHSSPLLALQELTNAAACTTVCRDDAVEGKEEKRDDAASASAAADSLRQAHSMLQFGCKRANSHTEKEEQQAQSRSPLKVPTFSCLFLLQSENLDLRQWPAGSCPVSLFLHFLIRCCKRLKKVNFTLCVC